MKILVTGGTGVISSCLVSEFVQRGHDVFAITRGNNKKRNIPGAKYYYADLNDSDAIKNIMKDTSFDIVIDCLIANVEMLERSMKYFSEKCKVYCLISTAGVFNDSIDSAEAEWGYIYGKEQCEEYLFRNKEKLACKFSIIRPCVTYGNYRIPFPIIDRNNQWLLFERLVSGKPIVACNNIKCSIVHTDDFARAVADCFETDKYIYKAITIAFHNSAHYWDEVIETAAMKLKCNFNIIHVPVADLKLTMPQLYNEVRFTKNKEIEIDCDTLYEIIPDFKPKMSLEDGIEKSIKYLREKNKKQKGSRTWDKESDLTIWYSYMRKQLTKDEMVIAKEYLKTWSLKKRLIIILSFACAEVLYLLRKVRRRLRNNKYIYKIYKSFRSR